MLLFYHTFELMQSILKNIAKHVSLTLEEEKLFLSKIETKNLKAKTILLPTGESLFDIISEYRYREFTLYPKVKEALVLYTFLHNK